MHQQTKQTKHNHCILSEPTLRRLFAAADAFRLLAPWRWMGDREVVAVRDPFSERVAYCVAMGMEGMCFGLDAMLGDLGLLEYRRVVSDKGKTKDMDALDMKDSFALLLLERGDISAEDLALAKQAGIEFSGPNAWPCFRRLEPGFYPWSLNEQDAAFMAVCLEQVVEVAFRAMKDPKILGPRDYRTFAARIPLQVDGAITWKDEFITPEPLESVIRILPRVDPARLGKALRSAEKTGMTWEADCSYGHIPIGGPGERPRYPLCYMVADVDSGFLFDTHLAENDFGASFIERMCEIFTRHKVAPSKIRIRNPQLASVFVPLASYGIKTELVTALPMIDAAREHMSKFFDRGTSKGSDRSTRGRKTVKSSTKSKKAVVYQFKVALNDVRPPVWRRFQVKSDITLHRLSTTIMMVMGWAGGHLHQFCIDGTEYGIPHEDYDEDNQPEDEREVRLSDIPQDVLGQFTYEYDFGDGWEHTVVLEKVTEPEKGVKYPVCIDGARSCPPEDCGGTVGYENFLAAIRNPKHPEHDSMLEWIGGEFDPEEFDPGDINYDLKHIASKEKFLNGEE